MATISRYFTDRIVEYPGRLRLIDVNYGSAEVVDVERAEGAVTNPGTPFSADSFNRIADEILDIEQYNADLIAGELTQTLTANTTYFNGTIKYDKIGSLVIVSIDGEATTHIAPGGVRTIASNTLASGFRPSETTSGIVRGVTNALFQASTGGSVGIIPFFDPIESETAIKGEVCYFV